MDVSGTRRSSVCRHCERIATDFCVFCGEPVAAPPADMVPIPAGRFAIGSPPAERAVLRKLLDGKLPDNAFATERPQWVTLSRPCFIDRRPVTVAEFARFVDKLPAREQKRLRIEPPALTAENARHPVTRVSWAAACAYAAARGKRLPTEAEWEVAAGWAFAQNAKQIFPWGDSADAKHPKCAMRGAIEPVDRHESVVSPAGCVDMVGNAAEWCADPYRDDYCFREYDESALQLAVEDLPRTIRGGACTCTLAQCRASWRQPAPSWAPTLLVGFRCVQAVGDARA
jgi:formylglycine-generating enzyme required for sulfatase activity